MGTLATMNQRGARSAEVEALLVGLTALRGVTAAAIVDADGLVTHIRRDFDINTDALGAAVQIVFGATDRAAKHVNQGNSALIISENRDGLVVLSPLSKGFILALVADSNALLGAIRFEVKETVPSLNQLF